MKSAGVVLCMCMSCAAMAQDPEFRAAVEEYRDGRWSSAYGRIVVLANNGHSDAARMALFMHQYGPLLYKSQWDASDDDIAHWTRVAGAWPRPSDAYRVRALQGPAKSQPAYRPRMARFQGRSAQSQPEVTKR